MAFMLCVGQKYANPEFSIQSIHPNYIQQLGCFHLRQLGEMVGIYALVIGRLGLKRLFVIVIE